MAQNAQYEIRCYADVIGYEIVSRWCPMAWESFLDYHIHSLELSALEQEVIKKISTGNLAEAVAVAEGFDWIKIEDGKLKDNIERAELEEKLELLELPIPWRELK
jgi:thymidylate synthase (FAD)